MLTASLAFATMGVCVKFGSQHFSSGELVFYRGIVGVVCMFVWARRLKISLKTKVPLMHLWRTTVGAISLSAWFYALAHLSIATAMTLNYMSSIWLTAFIAFGALFFGHNKQTQHHGLQAPLVFAVLVGFVGVMLVLRPAFEQGQELAGFIGLLSGFVAAFAYLQVTALARKGEPEVRTVFYFALGTVVIGLFSMGLTGTSPWPSWESKAALWLVPIGLLASVGQVCMTRAYSSGQTLLAASLQYMGIVFSALFGLLLFSEQIPAMAWLGMALIITSGIGATILRSRAMQSASAQPVSTPAEEF